MLLKITGLAVLQEIRRTSSVPVLMLTAIDDEYTQIHSFDEQADDYITKPFSMILLGKRITALLRRSGQNTMPDTMSFGDVTVNFSGYTAMDQKGKIELTPKEIDLLRLFVEHQGLVLFYTLELLLFVVLVAHALLYFLTPQIPLHLSTSPDNGDSLITGTFNITPYITRIIRRVLPLSLVCCVLISILCSLVFSKEITVPIKQISAVTERMARMDKTAACEIHAKDEIGVLAENINDLYQNLLATIENLKKKNNMCGKWRTESAAIKRKNSVGRRRQHCFFLILSEYKLSPHWPDYQTNALPAPTLPNLPRHLNPPLLRNPYPVDKRICCKQIYKGKLPHFISPKILLERKRSTITPGFKCRIYL